MTLVEFWCIANLLFNIIYWYTLKKVRKGVVLSSFQPDNHFMCKYSSNILQPRRSTEFVRFQPGIVTTSELLQNNERNSIIYSVETTQRQTGILRVEYLYDFKIANYVWYMCRIFMINHADLKKFFMCLSAGDFLPEFSAWF